MNVKFGWKKDIKDPKDFDFKKLRSVNIEDIDSEVNDIQEYMTEVGNQRMTSTCVANAAVDALEYLWKRKLRNRWCPKIDQYSRLFVYYFARLLDGDVSQDDGTYIRSAMNAMNKEGVCLEKLWEFEEKLLFVEPDQKAKEKASKRKIHDYYRITSFDDILIALHQRLPVIFGMTITEDFYNLNPHTWILPDKLEKPYAGGHAMLLAGYNLDNQLFLVRNSWGRDWGRDGYCMMPFVHLKSWTLGDTWVIRTHPND